MKTPKLIITSTLAAFIFLPHSGHSQIDTNRIIDSAIALYGPSGVVNFEQYMVTLDQVIDSYEEYVNASSVPIEDPIILEKVIEDRRNGNKHYTYRQVFKGIPLEGAQIRVHTIEVPMFGQIVRMVNGKLCREMDVDMEGVLLESQALASLWEALQLGEQYMVWEHAEWEEELKEETGDPEATYFPEGKLMFKLDNYIDVFAEIPKERYTLVWEFQIASLMGHTWTARVDAYSGEVLYWERNAIADGPATILTENGSSVLNIDTEERTWPLNGFVLKATGGDRNVRTKDFSETELENTQEGEVPDYGNWTFADNYTDDDDDWPQSAHRGTTAHYMVCEAWDFFSEKYSREGMNDNGKKVKVRADVAVWFDAEYSPDGAGDYISFGYRDHPDRYTATLDIAAHEFAHGIINYTSEIGGMQEPGAMNESYADIMGFMGERHSENTPAWLDWLFGEDAYQDAGDALRSFEDPMASGVHYTNPYLVPCYGTVDPGQPDTYKGQWWHPVDAIDCDKGGIHVNSGPHNYLFYLLANPNGGTHNGVNVGSIGIENAANIMWEVMTMTGLEVNGYDDARTLELEAAADEFNLNSYEYCQFVHAWAAIGDGKWPDSECFPAGIDDKHTVGPRLNIFPNPATDKVTIHCDEPMIGYEVYGIDGRIIMQGQTADQPQTTTLNISKLPSGTYLVRVVSATTKYSATFVK